MTHKIFNVTYNTWKTVYSNQNSDWNIYQYVAGNNSRIVWTGNREFVYTTEINSSTYSDYSSSFENSATNVSSSDDAQAMIIGLSDIKDPYQNNNALRVAVDIREGDELIFVSHNLADKTTWYHQSISIISQSLVPVNENNLIFSSSNSDHINWIDLEHGKYYKEDDIKDSYKVQVWVDGVEKTQRLWDLDSGGDFKVKSYHSGTIEFFEEVTGSVSASFNIENGSCWILEPNAGKKINVESAEAQFSENIVIDDSMKFEVYGYADVFAPQYVPVPYPPGTRIPIKTVTYKTFMQLVDEAMGAYPIISSISGSRGIKKRMYGFPFRYGTVRTLYSSYGMQIRISLENNRCLSGERGTVTFYCTSENE